MTVKELKKQIDFLQYFAALVLETADIEKLVDQLNEIFNFDEDFEVKSFKVDINKIIENLGSDVEEEFDQYENQLDEYNESNQLEIDNLNSKLKTKDERISELETEIFYFENGSP